LANFGVRYSSINLNTDKKNVGDIIKASIYFLQKVVDVHINRNNDK